MSDAAASVGLVNFNINPNFANVLKARGAKNLSRCIQCMRCGVGCPVEFAMDYNPTQIIRMCALGMEDEVLKSRTIWMCSSCVTCTTRCPMEIDVAGVMDILKEMAVERGIECPEPNTKRFHDIFMGIVRARGRMNEPMLFGHYKLRTKSFMDDMEIGKEMMKKMKIKYSPKVKGHKEVRKIIDKAGPKI